MQNKKGMHCIIKGKVQGVWFRASTQKQAVPLEITGWVRNLPDGGVEVTAFGEQEKLLILFEWLKQGPERAAVEDVTFQEIPWEMHERFAVK